MYEIFTLWKEIDDQILIELKFQLLMNNSMGMQAQVSVTLKFVICYKMLKLNFFSMKFSFNGNKLHLLVILAQNLKKCKR